MRARGRCGRVGRSERRHAGAGRGQGGGAPAGAAQRRGSLQQNRKSGKSEASGWSAARLLAEEDPGCVQQFCSTL
uniref:Proteasome 26S subunit, non-ATPase 7 n=1 Tax=Taeniopygia guttata TaxID=59729 RepID=B5G2A7_TAEGU|nr:putative proteasome 26S non-ATPase subunit 7 [Taeniopygia guttata]